MATVGDVTRADVMSLPNGRSKGCGIVEFSNPADAANAMAQLQEHDLKGRNIFLREDREEKGFATRPFAGRPFGVQGQAAGMPKSFESNSFVASAIRKEFDADCQVYVGNLPWNVSWQELKDIAANYGTVIR